MEQAKKQGTQRMYEEKWVHDSSVDHKGRAPLRASTGSWTAALFIIGKGITRAHQMRVTC